jgi:hypothetical protein
MAPMDRFLKKQALASTVMFDKIESSRTSDLKALPNAAIPLQVKRKLNSSDHGISIQKNDKICCEYLHYVFMEFSNFDNESDMVMGYIDLLQLFRLGGLLDEGDDDEDGGMLSTAQIFEVFRLFATSPWLNKSFAMSESDFSGGLMYLSGDILADSAE